MSEEVSTVKKPGDESVPKRDIELSESEIETRDKLIAEQPENSRYLNWTPSLCLFFFQMIRKYGIVKVRGEKMKNFWVLSRALKLKAKITPEFISGPTLAHKYSVLVEGVGKDLLRLSGGVTIKMVDLYGFLPKLKPWEVECVHAVVEERGHSLPENPESVSNDLIFLVPPPQPIPAAETTDPHAVSTLQKITAAAAASNELPSLPNLSQFPLLSSVAAATPNNKKRLHEDIDGEDSDEEVVDSTSQSVSKVPRLSKAGQRSSLAQALQSTEDMVLRDNISQLRSLRRSKQKLKLRIRDLRKALRSARNQAKIGGLVLKNIDFEQLLEEEIITDDEND